MVKRILLLLLWASTTQFVWGSAPEKNAPRTNAILANTDPCQLPPPTNFHVEDIGPTWVFLSWTPATPGVAYRIKTYRVAGNVLVSDIVVPPFMTSNVLVPGLQSGVTYYSTANAICPDGVDSEYKVITPDFDTIITELIVQGIQPTDNTPNCGIHSPGEYCEFPINGEITTFKVRPIGFPGGRLFYTQKVTDNGDQILRTIIDSPTHLYNFLIDGFPGNIDGVRGQTFTVVYQNNVRATFELYIHNNIGRIIWRNPPTGYEIVRISDAPKFREPSSERDESISEEGQMVMVSPNPFTDALAVYLTKSAEKVTLQLFNLSGQKVLDRQFEGKQEQYALSTADLSTGFYLLRIEADGDVQTLKVIKSE